MFYWFRSAPVKLFNSMLNTNSVTLRRVVQADHIIQPHSSACWTAQLLSAFQGLHGCERVKVYAGSHQRAIRKGSQLVLTLARAPP